MLKLMYKFECWLEEVGADTMKFRTNALKMQTPRIFDGRCTGGSVRFSEKN
jgi:hypothetical protein